MPRPTITVSVMLMRCTDKALCVSDGDVKDWIPKSQVTLGDCKVDDFDDMIPGHVYDITIPEWMAQEKGFI